MSEKVKVNVHRGTNTIGGCCTEITYKGTRIAIDLGSPLPGEDKKKLNVQGLTCGESKFDAVLCTHYHGDHIGEINRVNSDIPIYMSDFAKEVIKAYQDNKKTQYSEIDTANIRNLSAGRELKIGSFLIRPIRSDHSAAESFMFLIKADGFNILHTGDFRLHGKYRDELIEGLTNLGKIDLLITEGTTLFRKKNDEENYTEEKVEELIRGYIDENKYCFFILSSTNFDRFQGITKSIDSFRAKYRRIRRGKYYLVDDFQNKLLKVAEKYSPDRYSFKSHSKYGRNLNAGMEEKGFAMQLRTNNQEHEEIFKKYMTEYTDKTLLIYSMWSGYMERGKLKKITDFARERNRLRIVHSSGHVTIQDLEGFVKTINPKNVIVIHTESQEQLNVFENQIVVEDGVEVEF